MKNYIIRTLCTLALVMIFAGTFSQNQDNNQFSGPAIMITNSETGKTEPMQMESVAINVEIIDNVAVTTLDMTFFNTLNRQLEGELVFPLGEGQSVSRFAMEIKGKLREGVVVEKQKGQKVFEAIVRRRIDPALLEWTPGNNFKARIFPIPARGTKRVVITYEQELTSNDLAYTYKLPLQFSNKIKTVHLDFRVYNTDIPPQITSDFCHKLAFAKDFSCYKAETTEFDFNGNSELEVSLPFQHLKNFALTQSGKIDKQCYFYISMFKHKQSVQKKLPRSICVYWDGSSSETRRDTGRELTLLENYIKQCNNLNVKLVIFSSEIDTIIDYAVVNGECEKLLSAIKSIYYDGGTQLGALDFTTVSCDEILLFSDGVSNFGKSEITLSGTPVITINSSNTAEHSYLNYIAVKTSGEYLNLAKLSDNDAFEILTKSNLHFISAGFNPGEIGEVYPSNPQLCNGNITWAGVLYQPEAKIKLNFGFGNNITQSEEITLYRDTTPTNGITERIWAQKKIRDLQMDYKNNDDMITQTGKKYAIVTRNTSLIVLDSISDYVLYEILPPPEMQEQYYALLKNKKEKSEENFTAKITRLLNNYEQKVNWWNGNSDGQGMKPNNATGNNSSPVFIDIPDESPVTSQDSRPAINNNPVTIRSFSENHTGGITVTGRVVDKQTGEALPFATIISTNDSYGTTTDENGNFTINTEPNSQLKVSYLGYQSAIFTVTEPSNIEIPLEAANINIETFEVMEYRTPLISDDATNSVEIYSEDIRKMAAYNVGSLMGNISGIDISEEGETIHIRGARDNTTAIFVDGVRVSSMQSVARSDIEEIMVYEGGIPAQYGDLTGGVIDIRTHGYNNYYSDRIFGSYNENPLPDPREEKYPKPENAPWKAKLDSVPGRDIYKLYCRLKPEYTQSSAFYSDFADACLKNGQCKNALKIISNLAESELQNHELSRILARKLQQYGEKEYAILKYRDILKLRPEEPQSYRDFGLAYYDNCQYQEAVDMMYLILTKEWDNRFPGFETIVLGEISAMIASVGNKIDVSGIDKRLMNNLPVDLRIVLSWDADNTDMDLWVTSPGNELCYYRNKRPNFGGYLSQDYTRGYGPEEFLLKNARNGKYKIQVHYFGSGRQDFKRVVTINVQVFKNYGTPMQQKNEYILTLTNSSQLVNIENFAFNK